MIQLVAGCVVGVVGIALIIFFTLSPLFVRKAVEEDDAERSPNVLLEMKLKDFEAIDPR